MELKNTWGQESELKYVLSDMDSIARYYNITSYNKMTIDDILRGTNTIERIAASSQVLKKLGTSNCICVAATHDIELTYILQEIFLNMHFEEKILDKQILFSYKIHSGRAETRNAINLLSIIGYDEELIKNAEMSATKFDQKFKKIWLSELEVIPRT